MDCSKKTAAVKVILYALIFIGMSIKLTSSRLCDGDWNEYCNLKGVSIRTDTEASNFVYPNEKAIRFMHANISSSAKILFDRIPDGTEKMYISNGHVPELYIKQTIFEFSAFSCKLQEVIIDQTGTYKLRELVIWYSLFQSVPKNISKLTNLESLNLSYSKIETVSMDHFKDLLNLRYLKLYHNSIVRVDTTVPLNLPKLEELYLNGNNVKYLSITLWNFPNLKAFSASSNKLRNIINFPRQFPKLGEVWIYNNQWSCAWLESVKSELSKIIINHKEECSGKSIENVCCQDYSIDDISFASFKQPIDFGLLQISEKLQKAIQQIDEKISKLANDTKGLIDSKMSTVGRTIQEIKDDVKSVESGVKKQVEELQRNVANDRKHFHQASENLQKGIDHTNEGISKLTTETQAKVKSMESSIRTEVHQELTQITAKVDGNRASISESISKLTSDTKLLIDNKMSDVTRTVQEIKFTTEEQNQKLENLSVRIDGNRASTVENRKVLEEKISNSDNQNKEEFKRVQQKLNENRALINDVVEDLYLEELEKEEL